MSIVDPNREVAANYVAYDVALRDGGTQTGLLGDETLTHVRIKLPLGKELLLPRTGCAVAANPSCPKASRPSHLSRWRIYWRSLRDCKWGRLAIESARERSPRSDSFSMCPATRRLISARMDGTGRGGVWTFPRCA